MNANIYTGNVQPNHKEFKIWVNDEGTIKTWNGTEWIEQSGGGTSMKYYRIDWDNEYTEYDDFANALKNAHYLNFKLENGTKLIGTPYDVANWTSAHENTGFIRTSKIAVMDTIPIISAENDVRWVFNTGSWITNVTYDDYEAKELSNCLIPITEEEFYTMNDDEYPNPDANRPL